MSRKLQNENIQSAWDPKEPFQSLSLLPPESVNFDTVPILKKCIKARAALAELKQAAELIPDQTMLINILPILEARASSEIENIVTTTDRLFQYTQFEGQADPVTKEALRYSRALLGGFESIKKRPLNTRTAEEVCSIIKGVEMGVRRIPGTQLVNDKTKKVIYTPPQGEAHLRELLHNWEKFIHSTELDPLVRMAVGHYQFEAIHPFSDGNGRSGRVLNSLLLIEENLLGLPILYLSRYLIEKKDSYYRLLLDVTRNQSWEEWILFVLEGVEVTSIWTKEKIHAIKKLMVHTIAYVQKREPKVYSHELVNVIFELPYCRIQNVMQAVNSSRQAASRYLKRLAAIGVLKEIKVGREKLFIHPKLMALLENEENRYVGYPGGVEPKSPRRSRLQSGS